MKINLSFLKIVALSLGLILGIFTEGVAQGSRATDSLALVDLYNATDGANWMNKWILTQPMETWYGIKLTNERVTCIDLDGTVDCSYSNGINYGNYLVGTIPNLVLPNLQFFSLTSNGLSGSIPNFNLPNLQFISFSYNELSGSIPNFNLPSLQVLDFSFNRLSGSIPNFNLSSLQVLKLSHNRLSGSIPNFNLPNLQVLDFSGTGTLRNQLSGTIPNFNLPNLQKLNLSSNQLSGTIPNFNLPSLTELALLENQLNGNIPNFNLSNLKVISLYTNLLSGSIPNFNLPNLQSLYLGNNSLSGCIPNTLKIQCPVIGANRGNISNNPNLVTQSWANYWNNNEGACPLVDTTTCRYKDSLALSAFYRATKGQNWTIKDTIIDGIRKISPWNLNQPMTSWYGVTFNAQGCVDCLDLDGDATVCYSWSPTSPGMNLNGSLPDSIRLLTSLERLSLQGNRGLTGVFPTNFGQLSSLKWLLVERCNLTPPFPASFWTLPEIRFIALNQNPLNIAFPKEFARLTKLQGLELMQTQLQGSIPSEIGNLTDLGELQLGGNSLTGQIPTTFQNLTKLHKVGIDANKLDSLPNLSNLPFQIVYSSWGIYFNLIDNAFTFDDILPNIPLFNRIAPNYNYWRQDSIYKDTTITVRMGDPLSIDLKIDAGMSSNRYVWWKDNARFTELGDTLYVNKLNIPRIQASHAATYEVRVTNPKAPLLELISRKITINVVPNTSCRYNDSLQLVTLYNATNGVNWINKWDLTKPINTWYGVTLNTEGCVTCIDLDGIINCVYIPGITPGNGLSGTLPNLNLPALEALSLHFNNLSGTIPNFSLLPNLTYLGLCQNRFTGSIPTFNLLSKLQTLDLAGNLLSGSIPNFNLSSLEFLSLADNPLGSTIPNFSLPNLKQLHLSNDKLIGTIPNFNLPKLELLALSDNQLNNAIPNFNMPNLKELYLYKNQLTSSIPNFNLPNLRALVLNDNQLSGCIPQGIKTNCPFITATGGNITNNMGLNTQIWADYWNSSIGACTDTTSCRYKDSLQLVALYNATNGANWRIKTNWLTTNPINTWYGVTLNTDGCVSIIRLENNNLTGNIPSEIGQFSKLSNLTIDSNNITGIIPASIGQLLELQYLNLAKNNLLETIPNSFATLPKLIAIAIHDNQLTGSVPNFTSLELTEILLFRNKLNGLIPAWNLPKLRVLNLGDNQLSGAIPNFSLPNLEYLDLFSNQLSGNIPNFNMPNLLSLNLPNNKLIDTIPHFNLPKLQYLWLYDNKLSGAIPNLDLPNLKYFAANNNQLNGTIPNLNMPNLQGLWLFNNQLTGSIPNFNLPNLRYLSLYTNQLSGLLPSFQYLINLKHIDLRKNKLSGCFPTEWQRFCRFHFNASPSAYMDSIYNIVENPLLAWQGDFTRFCNNEVQIGATCNDGIATTFNDKIQLDCTCRGIDTVSCRYKDSLQLVALYNATGGANWLNKWDLTKPINTWYGVTLNTEGCVFKIELNDNYLKGQLPNLNLPNLQVLSLWQNQLTGVIPNFNLPNLKILDINTNKSLGGQIPDFNLPNLEHLNLGADSLTGNIPSSIGQLSQLKYIQLGPNNLTGSIPTSIGSLSLLETLILGSNKLTGVIPPEIGNCRNLKGIYLNSNPYLGGSIPNSISNLKSLRAIWVGNNFSSTIPESIGTLDSLEDLVLSDNKFTGKIPSIFNQLKVKRLWLQSNRLDSLPNLTNLPLIDTIAVAVLGGMRQAAGLVVHSNALTFDDILPNISFAQSAQFLYFPQDSIFKDTTITKNVGEIATINLGIDGALTTNKYVWFKKHGNTWVRFDSSNVNTLILRGVSACDVGEYKCEVTNPAAPLLTLKSRTIKIVVNGALSSYRLDTAICYGQTYRLPNLQTVNATTNFRDTVKNIRQCDSLIRIVNLTVSPKPDSTVQNAAICFGKTYTLPNGQIVTPSVNTMYRDTILLNGCPSRFRVTNLTVNALPTPIVNDTAICAGNSARLWIRNNSPNFRNYQWQTNSATTASATYTPSVTSTYFVTVTDANGCIGTDSARITVNSKPTAQITNLNSLYCKDNSTVTLQGQPTGGTFRLDGNTALNFNTNTVSIGNHSLNYIYRDVNNCADTATQTFRLADIARNTINRTICSGDTITINQKKYYKNKLTGIDTLRNASKDGCDSILTVQIAVYPKIRAYDDSTSIGQDKTETTINVLTNDIYPINMIDVNIVNKPRIGSIEEKGTGIFNIQMSRAANGFITFNYEICQMGCPNDCDTAMVKVFIKNANPEDIISTAITPNGDGNNDVLDFPEIDWNKYPDTRLEIFNRWGQFVFIDDHYKGKWGGLNQNGQELMTGDYFFILRANIGDGKIIVGSVYVER